MPGIVPAFVVGIASSGIKKASAPLLFSAAAAHGAMAIFGKLQLEAVCSSSSDCRGSILAGSIFLSVLSSQQCLLQCTRQSAGFAESIAQGPNTVEPNEVGFVPASVVSHQSLTEMAIIST